MSTIRFCVGKEKKSEAVLQCESAFTHLHTIQCLTRFIMRLQREYITHHTPECTSGQAVLAGLIDATVNSY